MRTLFFTGILLSFLTLTATAQNGPKPISEIESYSTKLVTLIDNFTIAWDRFSNRRQAKRTLRSIGFFQSDLRSYLEQRKYLLELLQENDFDRSRPLIISELKRLQNRFKRLSKRLYSIRVYVNDSNGSNSSEEFIRETFQIFGQQGEEAYPSVRPGIRRQRNFLSDLNSFLNGASIDKDELIAEGNRIEMGLERAIGSMQVIKEEIRNRYNL